ncbi:hypothetical protein Cgig2_000155 [Carnegiea gigantea]|uniref:Uncharacterized protein n=1 Tax=Carnegiea gigantea TaxID=171969 RepID=A0A9Q1JS09_9CARY|nr:hypothetical protein Cgig2_000155 [Carnegiea gigantea]
MVGALKNFMYTMTDAIMQQVSKQVKKAVEATSSTRPLPRFEYVSTAGCEPSHRHDFAMSPRHSERMQEALTLTKTENHGHSNGPMHTLANEVNYGFDAIRNTLPMNRLVRRTRADLKNFMYTMTDAIMQQVSKQVKKAVEATSSTRPLPRFEYVSTAGCDPSHRHDFAMPPRHSERMQEALTLTKTENHAYSNGPMHTLANEVNYGFDAIRNTLPMNRLVRRTRGDLKVSRPPLMTSAPKPYNVRKYCEFYEQSDHEITECCELTKTLHELADKG